MLIPSILLSLALPPAEARAGDRAIYSDIGESGSSYLGWRSLSVVVTDTSVASVDAVLSSDAGQETLSLVESDAWLHGVGTLSALPREDAAISLTLYDARRATLATFSGHLGADGSVSLVARGGSTGDCQSRVGCEEQAMADVELRGAATFASLEGEDFAVDLVGADAYDVVYATLTVTEAGEEECLSYNRAGDCVEWGAGSGTITSVAMDFDEIGAVWEGESVLLHEGPIELDLRTRDSRGRPQDSSSITLALPWLDEGAGASALPLRGDELTTVGLVDWQGATALTLASGGWTLGDALPVEAEVQLTGGGTVVLARHSIQRRAHHKAPIVGDYMDDLPDAFGQLGLVIDGGTLTIHGGSVILMDDSSVQVNNSGFRNRFNVSELGAPLCGDGVCVMLTRDTDGSLALSVTRYGWDEAFIAGETNARLTLYDSSGNAVASDVMDLVAGDELDLVFAAEVEFAGDPMHAALTGSVDLLDAPDRRGRQATLASGDFYSVVTRDVDGDISLSGVDNDDVASRPHTNFAVLLGGYSPACGSEDDGFVVTPPLAAVAGNGSGTRNPASSTSIRPQLL